jgi:YidC/Oxa1 family membrane protein insertase
VDKKSLIGLGLIALIMGVWLYLSGPSEAQIKQAKKQRDSMDLVERKAFEKQRQEQANKATSNASLNPLPLESDSVKNNREREQYRDFLPARHGLDTHCVLENQQLKVIISTKGGIIQQVYLSSYHRPGSKQPLPLFIADSSQMNLQWSAYNSTRIFESAEFYFKIIEHSKSHVKLRLETARKGSFMELNYRLPDQGFNVESSWSFTGMQSIITENVDQLQWNWSVLYPSQELHKSKEREVATVYFKNTVEDPDNINPMTSERQEIQEADVEWVSFKQQFFNATVWSKQGFLKSGSVVELQQRPENHTALARAHTELGIPYRHQAQEQFKYQFYFGPNHYPTLQQYNMQLEAIIPTGWSIFSYINKWLVIPLFNALDSLNMGWVILILTLIVKVLLFPIAYKTYMSGAKMRVLKPETDQLNAKFGSNADPLKKQQEQMALYRKAGVNPLSGCIPLLLQFPILIALFNFVPAAIELRQKPFLWAEDLSTYDTIWTFGELPFINWAYGDHISLFAALMFVSTIVYTYMNSNMMPQQNNQMPGMKFMMYFMPVIFLAVMNKYAAGLSWYYFLANMITFGQNYVIKWFVSDASIRAKLEENMKKPLKVSGFQKRLEEMARQRQQLKK